MYLFNWENVPGKDNGKLIEYLEQKYGVDWVRTAKIEKIDNNEIRIATEKNFLSLKLSNENTKATLTINKVRTDEFIVKKENSELNIYTKQDIRQRVKLVSSYPYSVLGGLIIGGMLIVGLLGYSGVESAGVFTQRQAFFVIGSSILILTAACLYLLFTLRNTISVLKIHEEELESARDSANEMRIASLENRNNPICRRTRIAVQDERIASLEGTRAGATTSPDTALELQLAKQETRIAALECDINQIREKIQR